MAELLFAALAFSFAPKILDQFPGFDENKRHNEEMKLKALEREQWMKARDKSMRYAEERVSEVRRSKVVFATLGQAEEEYYRAMHKRLIIPPEPSRQLNYSPVGEIKKLALTSALVTGAFMLGKYI